MLSQSPACVAHGRHDAGVPTPYPRLLSESEMAVLRALLRVEFDGVQAMRDKIDDVQVTGACGCGCPSVYFRSCQSSGGIGLVAEAVVTDGGQSVLLFTNAAGHLDSMESFWTTESIPTEFPSVNCLTVTAR